MEGKKRIKTGDIRGYVRLVKEATLGVTEIVQAMHHRVVHPPFLPSTPIQHAVTGIADITYFNIKTITRLIGGGLDKFAGIFPSSADDTAPGKRKDFLAILNGIIGDHMVRTKNPLAIPMQLYFQGQKLDIQSAAFQEALSVSEGKVMIMVHGLCGHDNRWEDGAINPSMRLADSLNYTPVYLHYNSGLHIAENGRQLNKLMNTVIRGRGASIREIVFIGHSMGGLVMRSSFHYAREENSKWLQLVRKMITLGTPHHGASLEKLGHYIDQVLEAIPYTQPFARLGKLRSAGITDLRYGVIADNSQDKKGRRSKAEGIRHVALPEGMECFAIAATKSLQANEKAKHIPGDGLVSVHSALGIHQQQNQNLDFPASNTHLCPGTGHTQLLISKEVFDKISDWILR